MMPPDRTVHLRDLWAVVVVVGLVDLDEAELDGEEKMGGMVIVRFVEKGVDGRGRIRLRRRGQLLQKGEAEEAEEGT